MNAKTPLRVFLTSVLIATFAVVGSVPANAAYAYLNAGGCKTTVLNGTSFGQTAVTSGVCNSKLIGIKVQHVGINAYWTGWRSSAGTHLYTYPPSGSWVLQSYHTILDGRAYKYLNVN